MRPALNAQKAHMRLMESTPAYRVSTHHQTSAEERRRRWWRVTSMSTHEINTRVKELKARGKRQFEIAAELRLSLVTVSRHVNNKIKSMR